MASTTKSEWVDISTPPEDEWVDIQTSPADDEIEKDDWVDISSETTDPVKSAEPKALNIHKKINPKTNFFLDKPVNEVELDMIAEGYGVDKNDLRDMVGWFGGVVPFNPNKSIQDNTAQVGKELVGKFGNMLTFGAPGWIAKKMIDDPALRLAADDLKALVSKKQSWVNDALNIAGGVGSAGKIAAGATKVLPKAGVQFYEPASALGSGASAGLFHSREGEEFKSAALGGLLGLGFYGGFRATGKAIEALKRPAGAVGEFEGPIPAPHIQGHFDDSIRNLDGIRAQKNEFVTEMLGKDPQAALEGPDRNLAIRYMEFVNENYSDATRDFTTIAQQRNQELTGRKIKEIVENFEEARRAGRVNPQSMDAFLLREDLSAKLLKENIEKTTMEMSEDATRKEIAEEALAENRIRKRRNILNRVAEAPFLRVAQAFRKIDDKTGTDLESGFRLAYQRNVAKTNWERTILDEFEKVKKLRDKTNDAIRKKYRGNPEKIEELLHTRSKITRDIENPDKVDEVTNAYRGLFKMLREESNAAGMNIRDLGHLYAPERKKTGVDLLEAIRKQADKMNILSDQAISDYKIADILRSKQRTPEVDDWLNSFQGDRRDLAFLIHATERLVKRPINTVADLREAILKDIKRGENIGNSLDHEVSALFKRDQTRPPEWLMEKNIDKLFTQGVRQHSRQIFMDPVAQHLAARAFYLRSLGYDNDAKYVLNYIQDIMEISRSNRVNAAALRAKADLWAREKGPVAEAAKELVDLSVQGFYASVMGARLDNVVRNLTQTFAKTVPEFGWARGTKYLGLAIKDLMKDAASGGWKRVVREAEEVYNLKPKTPRPSDFEGINNQMFNNMDDKLIRRARKIMNRYAEMSMALYMKSDEINRVLTVNMAKNAVKDMAKGGTKSLEKSIQRWPKSLQREIDMAVARNADPQELTQIIAGHLVPESQVAYGTVGRAQYHRDVGKIVATLSDFPAHMMSDAYYRVNRDLTKGVVELVHNYLPSLALFGAVGAMIDDRDPVARTLVGRGGVYGMHPAHALFKPMDVVAPPHVVNVMKFGEDLIGAPSEKEREKIFTKAVQNYGLLPGQIWRHKENIFDRPFEGERRGR